MIKTTGSNKHGYTSMTVASARMNRDNKVASYTYTAVRLLTRSMWFRFDVFMATVTTITNGFHR